MGTEVTLNGEPAGHSGLTITVDFKYTQVIGCEVIGVTRYPVPRSSLLNAEYTLCSAGGTVCVGEFPGDKDGDDMLFFVTGEIEVTR